MSWGTREVTEKKTSLGPEKTKPEETAKMEEIKNKTSYFGKSTNYPYAILQNQLKIKPI